MCVFGGGGQALDKLSLCSLYYHAHACAYATGACGSDRCMRACAQPQWGPQPVRSSWWCRPLGCQKPQARSPRLCARSSCAARTHEGDPGAAGGCRTARVWTHLLLLCFARCCVWMAAVHNAAAAVMVCAQWVDAGVVCAWLGGADRRWQLDWSALVWAASSRQASKRACAADARIQLGPPQSACQQATCCHSFIQI